MAVTVSLGRSGGGVCRKRGQTVDGYTELEAIFDLSEPLGLVSQELLAGHSR
jgi:hypothetical protein